MVFCHAGGRSAKASLMLDSLGFKEIYDLKVDTVVEIKL